MNRIVSSSTQVSLNGIGKAPLCRAGNLSTMSPVYSVNDLSGPDPSQPSPTRGEGAHRVRSIGQAIRVRWLCMLGEEERPECASNAIALGQGGTGGLRSRRSERENAV